jgi:hypothetical protein
MNKPFNASYMKASIRQATLVLLTLLGQQAAIAQDSHGIDTLVSRKAVTSAKLFGIGYTQHLDTYLSPGEYSGAELRFVSHTIRDNDDHPLSKLIVHQGFLSSTKNKAHNANELAGLYTFSYGLLYNWHFLDGDINLKAGATTNLELGFDYNLRNSNNPAQLRAALNISPTAAITYDTHLGNFPITLRYELAAPLMGVMFSPNYGQSYYEIFSRGDYDHNAVFTHPFNTPSLHHMLTLDITVMRQTFRMGYLGDVRQARVNGLRQHQYTHALVIGWVKHFRLIKYSPR